MVPIWLRTDQFGWSGENAGLGRICFNKANLLAAVVWGMTGTWGKKKEKKEGWQVESVYITFCTEWAKPISLKGTKPQTQVNKRPKMNKSTGRLISVIATCWEKGSWDTQHTHLTDGWSDWRIQFSLSDPWSDKILLWLYIIKWIWEWNLKMTHKTTQKGSVWKHNAGLVPLEATDSLTGCRITAWLPSPFKTGSLNKTGS